MAPFFGKFFKKIMNKMINELIMDKLFEIMKFRGDLLVDLNICSWFVSDITFTVGSNIVNQQNFVYCIFTVFL